MYYTINTPKGAVIIQSDSVDLAALKAEFAAETVGYITADGKQLIMMGLINQSIVTLAPYPPNLSDET